MKNTHFALIAILFSIISSCANTNGQTGHQTLAESAFSEKLKQHNNAILLDVRTPEEYNEGHIEKALNINWNSSSFAEQANQLDKQKTVFVYCLAGGRSASAANKLQEMGFANIYELQGGFLQWKAASLPVSKENTTKKSGMSIKDYELLLNTNNIALVDFYAEWCGPCKLMKPFLEEISNEMKNTVDVIRINVDENPELASALKIQGLPTIFIYKNQQITYSHMGFVDKATLVNQLK